MPLNDTQVKKAKPEKRPPERKKSARGNDDHKAVLTDQSASKSSGLATDNMTHREKQPKSYVRSILL